MLPYELNFRQLSHLNSIVSHQLPDEIIFRAEYRAVIDGRLHRVVVTKDMDSSRRPISDIKIEAKSSEKDYSFEEFSRKLSKGCKVSQLFEKYSVCMYKVTPVEFKLDLKSLFIED